MTISYKDYKGASLSFNDEKTSIFYSYKQYSLGLATNLSETLLPYLHILSKESSLFHIGLRDGDRIVQLGAWKQGMPQSFMEQEWEKMYNGETQISVLRPTASTYKRLTMKVASAKKGYEEYHFYLLTVPELNMLNNYMAKQ